MQKGSRKFSFGRLIQNAIPNFATDGAGEVDLSPQQADDLVQYQLSLPSSRYLGELSFFIARITDNKTSSEKVHKSLLKAGIITAAPAAFSPATKVKSNTSTSSNTNITTTASNGSSSAQQQQQQQPPPLPPPVTTSAIGKNFANQQPHISVHAQRKLVGMLFFWEEECTRWALLDQEEAEILRVIEEGGHVDNKELDLALRAVEMKRTLLPSQRAEHTANVGEGAGFNLPAYN